MLLGMSNLSQTYRLRALASGQRAREASDPIVKNDWEDLAIEWHLLANSSAKANGQTPHIEFDRRRRNTMTPKHRRQEVTPARAPEISEWSILNRQPVIRFFRSTGGIGPQKKGLSHAAIFFQRQQRGAHDPP